MKTEHIRAKTGGVEFLVKMIFLRDFIVTTLDDSNDAIL